MRDDRGVSTAESSDVASYPGHPTARLHRDPWDGETVADATPVASAVPFGRRHRRAQWLAKSALVLAVFTAAVVGLCLFLGLYSVRLSAAAPVDTAAFWLVTLAIAAAAALAVLLFAVLALLVCRPRRVAGLAVLAALVLPIAAGYLAVSSGAGVAVAHLGADGVPLADLVGPALDRLGVPTGPLRAIAGPLATWLSGPR